MVDLDKMRAKILALRNACDDMLQELDENTTQSTPVRTRQAKKEAMMLKFDAMYSKKRNKKSA